MGHLPLPLRRLEPSRLHRSVLGEPEEGPAKDPLRDEFSEFVQAGEKLAKLHVGYRGTEDYPLHSVVAPGVRLSYRIDRMKLSSDKTQLIVNDTLTMAGIPSEAFAYQLGGKSPLEWLIDQYRSPTTTRAGSRLILTSREMPSISLTSSPKLSGSASKPARSSRAFPSGRNTGVERTSRS